MKLRVWHVKCVDTSVLAFEAVEGQAVYLLFFHPQILKMRKKCREGWEPPAWVASEASRGRAYSLKRREVRIETSFLWQNHVIIWEQVTLLLTLKLIRNK
jgi:hypothetical protein